MSEFERFMRGLTNKDYKVVRTDKKAFGERLIAEKSRWGRANFRVLVYHFSKSKPSIKDFLAFTKDFEGFFGKFDRNYYIKGGYFLTYGEYDKKEFNYILNKLDTKISKLVKIKSLKAVVSEKAKKRRKIPKHVRNLVWTKYIGAEKPKGKCYVCRKAISFMSFEVGHDKAIAKGGYDHIDNLRPICKDCNLAMGTMSIKEFKRKYFKNT